ncbi:MAG: tagaturonate epimerase family protein [Bacteroidota bacterium]
MKLEQYSIGIGDRFGMECVAQLRALQMAESHGVSVVPVWNKSNREHTIIGTIPGDARRAADVAVQSCGWTASYYVDADHIGLATVEKFLEPSNFFTIDVADFIEKQASADVLSSFVKDMSRFRGSRAIPGVERPLSVSDEFLAAVAAKYALAVREAGKVYRFIAERKGADNFIAEISCDETNTPQSPAELFFILAAVAKEGVPIQTIAPKFSGSFLKGVDYVGELRQFRQEFEDDLAVVAHARSVFDLPKNLKLSIHSGSDKFSLYPIMHAAMKKFDAGLHLKTAGTTWLEEVIGLGSAGGDGLLFAKEIYAEAVKRFDELAKPYATVIHVDRNALPDPATVARWSPTEFSEALTHDQGCPRFDGQFRQLIHIAFRLAAERGERFRDLLRLHRESIEANVTGNLFDRHILPLFLGATAKDERLTAAANPAATI